MSKKNHLKPEYVHAWTPHKSSLHFQEQRWSLLSLYPSFPRSQNPPEVCGLDNKTLSQSQGQGLTEISGPVSCSFFSYFRVSYKVYYKVSRVTVVQINASHVSQPKIYEAFRGLTSASCPQPERLLSPSSDGAHVDDSWWPLSRSGRWYYHRGYSPVALFIFGARCFFAGGGGCLCTTGCLADPQPPAPLVPAAPSPTLPAANVSRHGQMSPGQQSCSPLRITARRQ